MVFTIPMEPTLERYVISWQQLKYPATLASTLIYTIVNTLLQVFIPSSWAVVFSMVGCAAIGTFFVPAEKEEESV